MPTQAYVAKRDSIHYQGRQKYFGQPYSYGASIGDLSKLDCSSFTAQVFKEKGITLLRINSKAFLL
ncbi:NlpC/P60 family protein [Priestia aryabhattai]|uniref:NlpC/P60 family protein n=1 Tax=Priestia aryabhattai TaxID=412384 RepID=UPI0035A093B1